MERKDARLGIDIGGTFTDMLVMDEETGKTYVLKTPSTPWPIDAVANGIRDLRERYGITGEQYTYFSHGTTIGLNTLLQRNGASVGMLITKGFKDVLELRRLRLPSPMDYFAKKPRSLVSRNHVREIDERMLANGEIYEPIKREEVIRAVEELVEEGVQAVAICFLHAYRNAEHEAAAKNWVQERFPELYVCTSADIWPQQREYERFLIAVMNAHIGGRVRDYLRDIGKETAELGMTCRILSTKSNGGVMTVASAAERPVDTLLSGPASGVIGSAYLGKLIGDSKIVTIDIGGTSADMAVIDGEVSYSTENTVGDFPVIMPAVDVSSIGAGGGSVAWLDADGVLKVGPRSAGAFPGPACYGRGGDQPTVTDAYVIAGIIDPGNFLGGTMQLYPELAEKAIGQLGERMGLSLQETADAILQVTSSMLYAELMPQMARRGVDIRDFSILGYGAGPTHVFMGARDLPVRRVIVPPTPGTMCALGSLAADLRSDFVRTVFCDTADLTPDQVREHYKQLDDEAGRWLASENDDGALVERSYMLRSIDMCYVGQSFDINVFLPETLEGITMDEIVRRFHERHQAVYGYADTTAPVRIITARVQIVGVTKKPLMGKPVQAEKHIGEGPRKRRIFENGQSLEAMVYDRANLKAGDRMEGPVIVEQYDTTVYVPAGFTMTVDPWLNLIGEKVDRESVAPVEKVIEQKVVSSVQSKVLLEIMRNRFQAIADEMALVAYRTAHTVFVKETQDYGVSLVTTKGEAFAAARRYGTLAMVAHTMDGAIAAIGDDVQEGDIFISNDPITSGAMATHLPDIYLWKPIFYQGKLVCFSWSFIHASDVGGKVPGSVSPSNYEIYQDGLRIPPRKLFRAGKLNDDILQMFFVNVRIAEQNWGDLKALLSALNTGERRIHGLLDQYGIGVVTEGIDSLLNYSEMQARRLIQHIPDGDYTYEDFMEGDKLGLGMIRIKLTLRKKDDNILLDYTGTDTQVRAALNLYSYSKPGHWSIIRGLTNWIMTMDPAVAFNHGMVRPLGVKIPSGTLLNPDDGVACGNRSGTMLRMTDVNLGALAQAIPDEVPGFGPGQSSILMVSIPDFQTGRSKISSIQPLIGGSGGRPMEDGPDGVDSIWCFMRNVPTEVLESDMTPLLINHYGLRPDSGGPGRYRGGMGVEIEFMTTSPYTMVTSRAMDRYTFAPPGRQGGMPGCTGYTTMNPGTSTEKDLGKIDILELSPGDVLRIGTQGGGGLGDPIDRPVEAVVEDVRNGLVSPAIALKGYGVVIDVRGVVDEDATARERKARRATRASVPPFFTFCEARNAYHKKWTVELEDAVWEALANEQTIRRQFLHQKLKTVIEERFARGEHIGPDALPAILAGLATSVGGDFPKKSKTRSNA